MSAPSFEQGAHTLKVIADQRPSDSDMYTLTGRGYLSDLVRAVKLGNLPSRMEFQRMLGLKHSFDVWKSVHVGLQTRKELVAALSGKLRRSLRGEWAVGLPDDQTMATQSELLVGLRKSSAPLCERREVQLARIPVLQFHQRDDNDSAGGLKFNEVCKRAGKWGLKPVSVEAMLQLAIDLPFLKYPEEGYDEWVGMAALDVALGRSASVAVGNGFLHEGLFASDSPLGCDWNVIFEIPQEPGQRPNKR
jgi:hypothetical protein